MSTTAQTDLTTLQGQLVQVGDSLSNIEDAKTLKAAQSSAKTGVSRLSTAQGTLTAAIAALNPTPTPVPTPIPTPTPTPTPGSLQPNVPAGTLPSMTLGFDEEFANLSNWNLQNSAGNLASNITVVNGQAVLTLSSASEGAWAIAKTPSVKVGDFVETRVLLPANTAGHTVNWGGVYTTSNTSPTWVEVDLLEVTSLGATVNTHWPSGGSEQQADNVAVGAAPGVWHVFGAWYFADHIQFFLDGEPSKSLPYTDNGAQQYPSLWWDAGNQSWNGPVLVGAQMLVEYVRVWAPA